MRNPLSATGGKCPGLLAVCAAFFPSVLCCHSGAVKSAADLSRLEINQGNPELLSEIASRGELKELRVYCLEDLDSLPEAIGNLGKLEVLDMDNGNGCSMHAAFPSRIGGLQKLKVLNLFGAQDFRGKGGEPAFPESMGKLASLRSLNLGRNGLKKIPPFVFRLTKLEELILDFNDLDELPVELSLMHSLRRLSLKGNEFKALPGYLATMPSLRVMDLGDNCAITQFEKSKTELQKKFPKITFQFENEFDCPPLPQPLKQGADTIMQGNGK